MILVDPPVINPNAASASPSRDSSHFVFILHLNYSYAPLNGFNRIKNTDTATGVVVGRSVKGRFVVAHQETSREDRLKERGTAIHFSLLPLFLTHLDTKKQ